jgi:hypothetical protein
MSQSRAEIAMDFARIAVPAGATLHGLFTYPIGG